MNIQQFKTNYTTGEQADGSLLVQIDNTAYVVRDFPTRAGLKVTHRVSIMMTPLLAAIGPDAAKNQEGFEPDMQDIIMGLGQGMETMSDDEFADFIEFCLGAVSMKVNKSDANIMGEMPAQPLFETHFRKHLHHLGILAAHVIVRGGVFNFFGGLVTVMSSQSQALKSASKSHETSVG